MKVTRFLNEKATEGALPPLLVRNKGVEEVFRLYFREKFQEIRKKKEETQ